MRVPASYAMGVVRVRLGSLFDGVTSGGFIGVLLQIAGYQYHPKSTNHMAGASTSTSGRVSPLAIVAAAFIARMVYSRCVLTCVQQWVLQRRGNPAIDSMAKVSCIHSCNGELEWGLEKRHFKRPFSPPKHRLSLVHKSIISHPQTSPHRHANADIQECDIRVLRDKT